jgi:hypothetical protein
MLRDFFMLYSRWEPEPEPPHKYFFRSRCRIKMMRLRNTAKSYNFYRVFEDPHFLLAGMPSEEVFPMG